MKENPDYKPLNIVEHKQKFQEIESWLLSLYPKMQEAAENGEYWIVAQNDVVKYLSENLELFLAVIHKHGFRLCGADKENNEVVIAWNNWAW
jgi:hypothetical protein